MSNLRIALTTGLVSVVGALNLWLGLYLWDAAPDQIIKLWAGAWVVLFVCVTFSMSVCTVVLLASVKSRLDK